MVHERRHRGRVSLRSPFVFDPWVRYDPERDRFYLLAAYYNFLENIGYYVFSVSDDSDPMGRWYNYAIKPIDTSGLVDYPKLGFDGEAVYLTQNFFDVTGTVFDGTIVFDEVALTILDKDAIANGESVTASIFQDLRNPDEIKAFTVQPAEQPLIDEKADQDRPFFMLNSEFGLPPDGDGLTLWTVEDPLDEPTIDCRTVDVPPYSLQPLSEQPGTDALIDIGDPRLINLVYDEDDDTLWTAHGIAQDWNGDGDLVSAIRWYEVDPFAADLVQSGLWGEPGKSYGYPTVNTTDESMMMTYTVVGPETFARMDVAGRTDDFTPGEIEDSKIVQEGESPYNAFQTDPVQRWGDYWGVSVDPETGTFWNIAQYSPDIDFDFDFDLYATRIAETTFLAETNGAKSKSAGGGKNGNGDKAGRVANSETDLGLDSVENLEALLDELLG